MSAKTWLKEFYAVSADKVSKAKAGAHCLRKWLGLTHEELKRHKLVYSPIVVNSSTCAYCTHYLRIVHIDGCVDCPLHKVLGHDCDALQGNPPYNKYAMSGNPFPMIDALREAITWERKHKPKRRKKP